jgi:hypothetical protein
MIESFPYYLLVAKGPNLNIKAFNDRYAILFQAEDPTGKPLNSVFEGDDVDKLVKCAKEAFQSGALVTTEPLAAHVGHDEARDNQFVHMIVPTKAADGRIDGVIIFTET